MVFFFNRMFWDGTGAKPQALAFYWNVFFVNKPSDHMLVAFGLAALALIIYLSRSRPQAQALRWLVASTPIIFASLTALFQLADWYNELSRSGYIGGMNDANEVHYLAAILLVRDGLAVSFVLYLILSGISALRIFLKLRSR